MNEFFSESWVQLVLILSLTFIVAGLLDKGSSVVERKQWLPATLMIPLSGFLRWSIWIFGIILALDSLGLPIKSLWTGMLSVMLVVAVAFFAMWSVLSNILCAVLLLTFSKARIGDVVELRDTKQDEVGIRGQIVDINLFYVTLKELTVESSISQEPALTQVPCHLFFYRVVRRWPGEKTSPLAGAFSDYSQAKQTDSKDTAPSKE